MLMAPVSLLLPVLAMLQVLPKGSDDRYATNWGHFDGSVTATWSSDGRTMILVEPFSYVDPVGNRWLAPKGAKIDGASIPKFAWSFIGGPFEGRYRDASVIHDVACDEQKRNWEDVHAAFYTAMRARGVDLGTAEIMYAAVYHFGPRWTYVAPSGEIVQPVPGSLIKSEFDELVKTIRARLPTAAGAMTLAEIRNYKPIRQ